MVPVYKFKKTMDRTDFSDRFRTIIIRQNILAIIYISCDSLHA